MFCCAHKHKVFILLYFLPFFGYGVVTKRKSVFLASIPIVKAMRASSINSSLRYHRQILKTHENKRKSQTMENSDQEKLKIKLGV